jgi:hypothetical protein
MEEQYEKDISKIKADTICFRNFECIQSDSPAICLIKEMPKNDQFVPVGSAYHPMCKNRFVQDSDSLCTCRLRVYLAKELGI